jgi:hypothetical protein
VEAETAWFGSLLGRAGLPVFASGQAARERVQLFTWKRAVEQLQQLYEEIQMR